MYDVTISKMHIRPLYNNCEAFVSTTKAVILGKTMNSVWAVNENSGVLGCVVVKRYSGRRHLSESDRCFPLCVGATRCQ